MRLLLVDDEPESNEVVQEILASRGAEVRVAGSAHDARETLGRWRPHLVVSDIGMPGEKGYAFIASLRAKDGEGSQVPALALTAYAAARTRSGCSPPASRPTFRSRSTRASWSPSSRTWRGSRAKL